MRINIPHLFIVSIAGMSLAACTKSDEPQVYPKSETTTLNLTLAVNSQYNNNSRAGGNNYIPEGYQVRYTVAAFVETNGIPSEKEVTRTTAYSEIAPEGGSQLTDAFSNLHLNLVPHTSYTLVAWADYVRPADATTITKAQTTFYNIDDLRAITPIGNQPLSGVDAEDAYLYTQTGYRVNNDDLNQTLTLSLKRPLVKIEFQNISGIPAGPYSLDCTFDSNSPTETVTTFDAITHKVTGNHIRLGETTDTSPYGYVFAPADGCNLSVSIMADEVPYGIKWEENSLPTPLRLFVQTNQKVTVQPTEGNQLMLHSLINQ